MNQQPLHKKIQKKTYQMKWKMWMPKYKKYEKRAGKPVIHRSLKNKLQEV